MDSDEPAILPDDTGGGRLAAEHLLSLVEAPVRPYHLPGARFAMCLCVPRISSAALTCKVAFSLVRP